MIEPFFFNNDKLFGCYHAAEDWSAPRLLVVCPPLFDEYRRCYRALSDLANACAKENVHVVRFDYFGTGESNGNLEEARLSDWLEGIEAAIEEGVAISGAEDVVLFGVRFGATLAAQASSTKVTRRVYWDAVKSGKDYLMWLDQVNNSITVDHLAMAKAANRQMEKVDFQNFVLSQQLRQDLERLQFDSNQILSDKNSFLISTNKSEVENSDSAILEFANFHYDWPEYHDGILAPKPVLEAIAQKVLLP